jgi:hypothetical protein
MSHADRTRVGLAPGPAETLLPEKRKVGGSTPPLTTTHTSEFCSVNCGEYDPGDRRCCLLMTVSDLWCPLWRLVHVGGTGSAAEMVTIDLGDEDIRAVRLSPT